MIALPKAISQGSNATGGGAFTALTRISAAKAEPDTSVSAVANNTSFFMTIPITLLEQSRSGGPQGQAITDCNQIPERDCNLVRGVAGVKQKSQSSAAFLGVLIISENVVSGCCIPTTILRVFVSGRRHLEPEKQESNQRPMEIPGESNGLRGNAGRATARDPGPRKKPQR